MVNQGLRHVPPRHRGCGYVDVVGERRGEPKRNQRLDRVDHDEYGERRDGPSQRRFPGKPSEPRPEIWRAGHAQRKAGKVEAEVHEEVALGHERRHRVQSTVHQGEKDDRTASRQRGSRVVIPSVFWGERAQHLQQIVASEGLQEGRGPDEVAKGTRERARKDSRHSQEWLDARVAEHRAVVLQLVALEAHGEKHQESHVHSGGERHGAERTRRDRSGWALELAAHARPSGDAGGGRVHDDQDRPKRLEPIPRGPCALVVFGEVKPQVLAQIGDGGARTAFGHQDARGADDERGQHDERHDVAQRRCGLATQHVGSEHGRERNARDGHGEPPVPLVVLAAWLCVAQEGVHDRFGQGDQGERAGEALCENEEQARGGA
mmetsp:Transcript_13868/g.44378  ORF Transcript_13868/g.44378 Transcript_13868/m.44378 type:complete len:377 (-) Transcript_13868:229-1359(-)